MLSFPISLPLSNRFVVLVAPHAAWQDMLELSAQLALQGPLRIFDGGNRTNVYFIAKTIRRQSPMVNECLTRIHLTRAFTCYQLVSLLCNAPADQKPLLVLDLLATFYDENVSLAEARRLLQRALREFERFRRQAPLVVSVRSTAPDLERSVLLEELAARADEVFVLENISPSPAQETQLSFPF
jgi:hypothetical protein